MEPDERRLHPSSLLFHLLGHAKGLVVPALVVLVLASGDAWQLWLGVLVVPSMLFEGWRYLTFRYRFEPDALVLTQGVVFKSQRHVPFDRIQSVDLVRGPLARLFRVAEVRIETAGGTEAEAHLKVVSLEHVEEIRRRVFRGRAPAEPERAPAGREEAASVLRLRGADYLLLGMDLGRGLALIAVALGLAYELELFDRLKGLGLEDRAESALEGLDGGALALTVGFAAVSLLLLVFLLSLGWTVVRLAGFELRRSGEDFRLGCGLFTRLEATIPRSRIQLVSVRESPLLRLLGRVSVRVELAASDPLEAREASVSKRWFAPIVRRPALAALLREVDPRLALEELAWRPLSPRARRRTLRKALLVALALSAPCFLFGPRFGLAAAVGLLVASLLHARAEARFLAHARSSWGVAFRSGAWTRKWSLTWLDRAQVLVLSESPFDRRHRMASLAVDTAGAGPAGHRVAVPYLDRDEAERLQLELAAAAFRARAGARLRWRG